MDWIVVITTLGIIGFIAYKIYDKNFRNENNEQKKTEKNKTICHLCSLKIQEDTEIDVNQIPYHEKCLKIINELLTTYK